jgi:ribosomal protein S18 acetylase RimI-like enzyme
VRLRRATPSDAEAILALWRASEATESVTDRLDDVRRVSTLERAAFILAVNDGDIVGSIIATFDGWRGNLYRLATHPDHRRRGIARALVGEAENALRTWGARRVTALVEKDHPWAVGFWQAVGYAVDERIARHVRDLAGPTSPPRADPAPDRRGARAGGR